MNNKQKNSLMKIIAAILLLAAAVLIPCPAPYNALLYLLPYAAVGFTTVKKAFINIMHGQVFDENFLMLIASAGAFFLGEYIESVAVMLFYAIGELFESYAVGKSRKSIADLMDIRPEYANLFKDGKLVRVSPEDVHAGDVIAVKPGERVPLDGVVCEGMSALDTSALTGESIPRTVKVGDDVISGCINRDRAIHVKVTKEFENSTVSKILELVENSAASKAKSENFITKFARYYTPSVVAAAALLAIVPPFFDGMDFAKWIARALIFLVISCPCALVISVPLSYFGGIGCASANGILIKGSNYLEALAKTDTVVFDKTGTLTVGCFKVTATHPEVISKEKLLEIAARAEFYSNHPIAFALRQAAVLSPKCGACEDFTEISGKGISCMIDKQRVHVGNAKLMEECGASWRPCHHDGTIVHIAIDGEYAGHIVISDGIKPDAAEAIEKLKACGIKKTVMLTGDAKSVGESVAKTLNIDECHAELFPEEKVSHIEKLLQDKSGGTLAFVGDGINDAPVLTRADVGIAMGGLGSDAAIEAADIVLMDDKPSKIALAVKISRRTHKIVIQNIIFALAVKAVIMAFGAVGLAGMWLAVFADVGVSVIAILNSMRALKIRK